MQLISVSKTVSCVISNYRMPGFRDSHFKLNGKSKDLALLLLMEVANPAVRINRINKGRYLDGHAGSLAEIIDKVQCGCGSCRDRDLVLGVVMAPFNDKALSLSQFGSDSCTLGTQFGIKLNVKQPI